jgi:cyclohexa-1,5-dienecarbonyl-CoA hydratase
VTLSHGRQNVIDFPMMDELSMTLDSCESDSAISTLLLRGEGENFSAGVDIPSHTPDKVATMLAKFHAVIRRLARSQKVLVAEVRGNCLGGGAELALMCDLVYTTPEARWGFPEIQLACFPPVACAILADLTGPRLAAELVLTGRSFTGVQAVEYRLANSSGDAAQLAADTLLQFGALSAEVLPIAKRALGRGRMEEFLARLAEAESLYLDELVPSKDMERAIRGWMERRNG